MPIINIEGASAVGKTTTSRELALRHNGFHIPEVNALWKRPDPDYPEWFFERQVDRWTIAQEKSQDHRFVVIDIDLFQPFWYIWAYNFTLFGGQTLDFVAEFYRKQLLARKIGFPDRYYLLSASQSALRQRKEGDITRRRGGFEMHLQFIEPQRQYFKALESFVPGLVCFIESESIDCNVAQITNRMPLRSGEHTYSMELFEFMINWLRDHPAAVFI